MVESYGLIDFSWQYGLICLIFPLSHKFLMGEIPLIPGISSRAGVVEEWMMVGCESVRPWQRIRCSAQIGWSCRYYLDPSTSRKNCVYIYILYPYIYILYQMGQHIQYPSTYPNQMGQHLDIESNIIDPSTCRNNCSIYIGFNLSPMIDLGPWKNHPSPAMKPQGLLRITQLRQYGLPQVSFPMKICRKT